MFDVVVVGAGPVGLYTTKLCEDLGYKVVVLEEHGKIGEPLQCSGLISSNIEKFFSDIKEWNVIDNEVDSAIVHSPKNEFVLKKKNAAYVIDRSKFDKRLGGIVKSKILLNCKVGSIVVRKDCVEVNTTKGRVRGRLVGGCDGTNSVVAKGLCVKPKEKIKGLIGVVNEKSYSKNVDLYFDKSRLKDGFFWKIPRGRKLEYGVLGRDVNFNDLEKFFGIKKYEKFAGLIPIGSVKKSYFDRILLIGDAAGQVKPWSGGGVVYGLTSASIASSVMKRAFEKNDFSERVLKEYETLWRARIGKQIGFGLFLRKIIKTVNNMQLEMLFRTGKLMDFRWMDMDFIF
ncbi:MAG: NAD(P)-binding protein [Candidatus Aenigmarchaeota archaeon]|nr:NAD(P)-binding protein [Candidatus Aenigmarchaeota archaeon]